MSIEDSNEPTPTKELDPLTTLSQSQRQAFDELKALCEKSDVSWPTSEVEGDHSGGVLNNYVLLCAALLVRSGTKLTALSRYLRARNFQAHAAFKQYSASATWRRNKQLDKIYDNVEIEEFEILRRLQPQWTGRRDLNNIPVMVYVLSNVRPEDIVEIGRTDPELSNVFLPAEYVTQFVQPLCGAIHGGNISRSNNIIDLSNVGLRDFWKLRKLLQKASNMATAHYPETVERIFVIGAPGYFPTIWKLITAWFEPATTRKIYILSARETTTTLTKFIASGDLPERFGGTLNWNFGMFPILDEKAVALTNTLNTKWIEGPLRFIEKDNLQKVIAVGTENGTPRRTYL